MDASAAILVVYPRLCDLPATGQILVTTAEALAGRSRVLSPDERMTLSMGGGWAPHGLATVPDGQIALLLF